MNPADIPTDAFDVLQKIARRVEVKSKGNLKLCDKIIEYAFNTQPRFLVCVFECAFKYRLLQDLDDMIGYGPVFNELFDRLIKKIEETCADGTMASVLRGLNVGMRLEHIKDFEYLKEHSIAIPYPNVEYHGSICSDADMCPKNEPSWMKSLYVERPCGPGDDFVWCEIAISSFYTAPWELVGKRDEDFCRDVFANCVHKEDFVRAVLDGDRAALQHQLVGAAANYTTQLLTSAEKASEPNRE